MGIMIVVSIISIYSLAFYSVIKGRVKLHKPLLDSHRRSRDV